HAQVYLDHPCGAGNLCLSSDAKPQTPSYCLIQLLPWHGAPPQLVPRHLLEPSTPPSI
ncbi:hypothetical protein A2U01_0048077, partial [Trifolium medium]|nr:hypothetical protein [Trifolium medium]